MIQSRWQMVPILFQAKERVNDPSVVRFKVCKTFTNRPFFRVCIGPNPLSDDKTSLRYYIFRSWSVASFAIFHLYCAPGQTGFKWSGVLLGFASWLGGETFPDAEIS